MDDKRFDAISKLLGTAATRQSVFKLLTGLGASGLAALTGLDPGEAKKRKGHGGRDKSKSKSKKRNSRQRGPDQGSGPTPRLSGDCGGNPRDPKIYWCHCTPSVGNTNCNTLCLPTNAECNGQAVPEGHDPCKANHEDDCRCGDPGCECGTEQSCCKSQSGTCQIDEQCCSGLKCTDGTCRPCTPKTCADFPAGTCGEQNDGCGGRTRDCPCPGGEECVNGSCKPIACDGNCNISSENTRLCPDLANCLCDLKEGTAGTCIECPKDRVCGPVCCPRGDTCKDASKGICEPPPQICDGQPCETPDICQKISKDCICVFPTNGTASADTTRGTCQICTPKTCKDFPADVCGPQDDGCGGKTRDCPCPDGRDCVNGTCKQVTCAGGCNPRTGCPDVPDELCICVEQPVCPQPGETRNGRPCTLSSECQSCCCVNRGQSQVCASPSPSNPVCQGAPAVTETNDTGVCESCPKRQICGTGEHRVCCEADQDCVQGVCRDKVCDGQPCETREFCQKFSRDCVCLFPVNGQPTVQPVPRHCGTCLPDGTATTHPEECCSDKYCEATQTCGPCQVCEGRCNTLEGKDALRCPKIDGVDCQCVFPKNADGTPHPEGTCQEPKICRGECDSDDACRRISDDCTCVFARDARTGTPHPKGICQKQEICAGSCSREDPCPKIDGVDCQCVFHRDSAGQTLSEGTCEARICRGECDSQEDCREISRDCACVFSGDDDERTGTQHPTGTCQKQEICAGSCSRKDPCPRIPGVNCVCDIDHKKSGNGGTPHGVCREQRICGGDCTPNALHDACREFGPSCFCERISSLSGDHGVCTTGGGGGGGGGCVSNPVSCQRGQEDLCSPNVDNCGKPCVCPALTECDEPEGICKPFVCVPETFAEACTAVGRDCDLVSDGCGGEILCGTCATNALCEAGACKVKRKRKRKKRGKNKKRCTGGGLAGQRCSGKCQCHGGRRCNNGTCCEPVGDGHLHCNANGDCCPGLTCARKRPGQHKVCLTRRRASEVVATPGFALGAVLSGLLVKAASRVFGASPNAALALDDLGTQDVSR